VQFNAIGALASLAEGDFPIQAAIAAQPGTVPELRLLLSSSSSAHVQLSAADLLAGLATVAPGAADVPAAAVVA
jgi:hypothetical protein